MLSPNALIISAGIFACLIPKIAWAEAEGQLAHILKLRAVAITVDDLPVARASDLKMKQFITTALLAKIRAHDIPAVGFVNEHNLGEPTPAPEQIELLKAWLRSGLELGNHTYSHPSFFNTPLDDFKREVLRGELVTKRLLKEHGRGIRYFRHPFLNTGPNLETKVAFEVFLAKRGYTVAPVTIDNDEWVYASVYDKAEAVGNTLLASQIGEDYIRYMQEIFDFYEQLSRDLLKREPAQVLLIHANKLNADYFSKLADMLSARGYKFVSLEQVLRDPAYLLPDEYVGQAGISWLQRWWITQGNEFRPEPTIPPWVTGSSNRSDALVDF